MIPLIIGMTAIIIFWMVSYTITPVAFFIPGVVISYLVYLKLFYKRSSDPVRLLPLYLFLLAVQLLHFAEEYVTGFTIEMAKLLSDETYPINYWVTFNMVAYAIFILGGIVLFKRMTEFMIIPVFFLVVGVLLNAAAHILISIYVGGYFPGLFSACLYALCVPFLVKTMTREGHSMVYPGT